jgi:hypothetical protein
MEPIKYQLSKMEFIIALAIRIWHTNRFILVVIISLLIVIASWIIGLIPLSALLMFVLVLLLMPLVPLIWINMILKLHPNLFLSETTIVLTGEVLRINNANGIYNLNWSGINTWFETARYIFIICCPAPRGLIIPKRAFTSEQLMEFKTLLAEKIQPS